MGASTLVTNEAARALYAAGDAAHDFDHVERVTRLAEGLAAVEGADGEIVRLAALLHDAPVAADDSHAMRRDHHLAAADFAGDFLRTSGLAADRVAAVVHCIESHRFRDQTRQPQTLEAQCLYDADKLDSMGAIGVARAFAYAGAHGTRLWHEPWTAAPGYAGIDKKIYDKRPYDVIHQLVRQIGRNIEGEYYINEAPVSDPMAGVIPEPTQ